MNHYKMMANDCNGQSQSKSEESGVCDEYPDIISQRGFKNSWKREKIDILGFGGED